jgi:hypothetical protein
MRSTTRDRLRQYGRFISDCSALVGVVVLGYAAARTIEFFSSF